MTRSTTSNDDTARRRTAHASCGFSLIEMLTVVGVMTILLMVAAAGFGNMFRSNRLYSSQGQFASALAFARSEAVTRGLPVVVSATSSTSGNEFGGGWTVYVDANGNGSLDGGETELRKQDALPTDIVAKTGGTSSLTFGSAGFLVPTTAVTVRFCRASTAVDPAPEYTVVVQPNGLADVTQVACP